MSALEEHLIGQPELDDVEDLDETAPDSMEAADWQVRKLARLRRLMAENEAIANAEIQRIKVWLADENAKLERQAGFYEGNLELFHQALLEKDPKRKSIALPAGTLKARKHPDRLDVVDVDEFTAWALEERPEFVRIKHEPNKTEMKRLLGVDGERVVDPTSGEPVPGVVCVAGEISFTVDTVGRQGVTA